jgi:hypothetical protein
MELLASSLYARRERTVMRPTCRYFWKSEVFTATKRDGQKILERAGYGTIPPPMSYTVTNFRSCSIARAICVFFSSRKAEPYIGPVDVSVIRAASLWEYRHAVSVHKHPSFLQWFVELVSSSARRLHASWSRPFSHCTNHKRSRTTFGKQYLVRVWEG